MNSKRLSPLSWVLILSAIFFAVFLLISGVMYLYKSPGGGTVAAGGKSNSALFGGGAVGVIELNGVIMDSKKTLARLQSFEDNDQIKALVIRLNSPGGAVAPSQEIYEAVKAFKKPVVVSMSSVAASGAYYVACAAKKVYANAGTITGSIGVIMEFANLSRLYEWAKVKRYSIKTGKYKDAGAEYRDMTDDERALLQGMVDDVLVQFKTAVSTGRKIPMDQVTKIADGRIFSGAQAKAAKLVDEIGTLQDAIDEAGREAKIKGKPTVLYPAGPKRRLLEMLFEDSKGEESETPLAPSSLSEMVRRLMGAAGAPAGMSEAPLIAPGVYWLWNGAR